MLLRWHRPQRSAELVRWKRGCAVDPSRPGDGRDEENRHLLHPAEMISYAPKKIARTQNRYGRMTGRVIGCIVGHQEPALLLYSRHEMRYVFPVGPIGHAIDLGF